MGNNETKKLAKRLDDEDIGYLINDGNKLQRDIFIGNLLTNEVHINLNVFGTGVEHWIEGQGECTNVITPDNGTRQKRKSEVLK